jgi:hypothetical protein
LPPTPTPWPFRDKTTQLAGQIMTAVNNAGVPAGGLVGARIDRLIRAALLDKEIYRKVAADAALQLETWLLLLTVVFAMTFGSVLWAIIRGQFAGFFSIFGTFIIHFIAWLVRIWAVKVLANLWLKSPLSYQQYFRALSYAQAPAVLQFIPILGLVTVPWVLVTNATAIHDLTAAGTVKVIVLTVVGFVAMLLTGAIVGPAVRYIF